MDWYVNPAIHTFRAEVNAAYPARDKASDGTIGNAAHAASVSDHNPDVDGSVDAWDMDVDLGVPNAAAEIERLKRLFQAHPASEYWIHNDQIAGRWDGWVRRSYAYAGPSRNRHDKHVHWNSNQANETSTRPWGVETDMPLTDSDKPIIRAAVAGMEVGSGTGVSLSSAMHTTRTGVMSLMKVCEAILLAVTTGADSKKIMARVEQIAVEDAKRDADLAVAVARSNAMVDRIGALVEQIKTGDLTSEGVARELARIIGAGANASPGNS